MRVPAEPQFSQSLLDMECESDDNQMDVDINISSVDLYPAELLVRFDGPTDSSEDELMDNFSAVDISDSTNDEARGASNSSPTELSNSN